MNIVNITNNKITLILLGILMVLFSFSFSPVTVKADWMKVSATPNPVDFNHYVTLTWSCPSGNCKAVSDPVYTEWSGNITQKNGTKKILIDKFKEIKPYLGTRYWGVKLELDDNNGPGISENDLKINKDSLIYLTAINNKTGEHSTSTLRVTKHDATTTGISIQYSCAPGTWQKVSNPNNSNWQGETTKQTDFININPLSTSTAFCLGMPSEELGSCVSVIVGNTPPPPPPPVHSPKASISAIPNWIAVNGSTTVTWSSQNVDSCIVKEIPQGGTGSTISTSSLQGTQEIDNISTTTDFSIVCKKGAKTASAKTTVIVSASPPPPAYKIVLYADPTSITKGDSTKLYWDLDGNDATKCSPTSSPDNSQWESVSLSATGSISISDLEKTTSFYINCPSVSATTTVHVTNKQKPSPMEIVNDYFTRDIMSTQICHHVNQGSSQWDCDKDQEQFCTDYKKYILDNLHTFDPDSIKDLEKNSGCHNKKVDTANWLSILSGEIFSTNWLQNILQTFAHSSYSKYITNIDYILRKAEVNRCLFDQCCIYSGKTENLNETIEGTEEPKYPMSAQEVKESGAFLTKREEENIRNMLDFFCCR